MTSNDSAIIFEEKQYLGHNRLSIIRRSVLAAFCFIGYYWSENPKSVQVVANIKIRSYPVEHIPHSGQIFFLIGLFILILSAALTYVLHIHTKVYNGYIIIDGFWTARRVKIDLNTITRIRKSRYKKISFKRAVYNLHSRGIIRFYSSGEDFVQLIDQSGFSYRIGTQKAVELYSAVKIQLKKKTID